MAYSFPRMPEPPPKKPRETPSPPRKDHTKCLELRDLLHVDEVLALVFPVSGVAERRSADQVVEAELAARLVQPGSVPQLAQIDVLALAHVQRAVVQALEEHAL